MNLSSEVLDWSFYDETASGLENEMRYRAHEMWRHARKRLAENSTEFDRIDAIGTLKRSINHRLKSLRTTYCIDALPFDGTKKVLEKFQHYGLIRPTLIKELIGVRNEIEHEDVLPPNIESCNRYLDYVWYFIKSTDSLLYMQIDDIVFTQPDENGQLKFTVKFESGWHILVRGTVDKGYYASNDSDDSLVIEEIADRPDFLKDDIYGIFKPTSGQLEEFARYYFGCSGFWWDDHV